MIKSLNESTIELIQREYLRDNLPWLMGFSGGKDSSALLKLMFVALRYLKKRPKPVTILYCDTGVEIPIVRKLVHKTLRGVAREAKLLDIPIHIKIVKPELKNSFFVKLIGRGYPPPSNKFRWCTDRLRINPVKKALASAPNDKSIVLLGIRHGESLERDKTIKKHMEKNYYFRQSGNRSVLIFAPIVNYGVEEIWSTLVYLSEPKSVDENSLATLYKDASGECPLIRDPRGIPCGKGRFGCWTCTVVRKDRAVTNMVNEGYAQLAPLLTFRNWLVEIRDNPYYRCKRRRNGQKGLGPFTLTARKKILRKLFEAEAKSNSQLICEEELILIQKLWKEDKRSPIYSEGK